MAGHSGRRAGVGTVVVCRADRRRVNQLAAFAEVRIVNDLGGEVSSYVQKFQQMRAAGEHVVIDGPCLSACTLLTGIIPRDQVCVTSRAELGFHAASYYDDASRSLVPTREGSRVVMRLYPPAIRAWIGRHGGLTPHPEVHAGPGTDGALSDLPVIVGFGGDPARATARWRWPAGVVRRSCSGLSRSHVAGSLPPGSSSSPIPQGLVGSRERAAAASVCDLLWRPAFCRNGPGGQRLTLGALRNHGLFRNNPRRFYGVFRLMGL